MAWSYRRRIKIIPGVHLNLSKSGISTTIGVKGASVNFGPMGTFINTGIPVLGISNRHQLSGASPQPAYKHTVPVLPTATDGAIFSADVEVITSQGMQGIKEAIIMANQQRRELQQDLLRVDASIAGSKTRLMLSYLLLYGLFKRSIADNIKADIKAKQDALAQLKEQIEHCYVELDVAFDPEIQVPYQRLVTAFKQMAASQKIWDVTSARHQDRVAARSSASIIVEKKEVRFGIKSLPDIKTDLEVLYFQNANGADLYLYPGFIVMYSSKASFALIGPDELRFGYHGVRFTETGVVPSDSKIIDRTWAKVNKNGTPDKRFNDNYQIPVVKYGCFTMETATGVNEEYECSNYESTELFGQAFTAYQAVIRSLRQL